MKNPIPEQIALEICELVRQRNSKKNKVKARCWFNSEVKVNRGCELINKVFDSEYSKTQ